MFNFIAPTWYLSCSWSGSKHSNSQQRSPTRKFLQNCRIGKEEEEEKEAVGYYWWLMGNKFDTAVDLSSSCKQCRLLLRWWSMGWRWRNYTHVGRIAENCFAPHRLRVIADAKTTHRWPRDIEDAMIEDIPLKIRAVLVEGGYAGQAKRRDSY